VSRRTSDFGLILIALMLAAVAIAAVMDLLDGLAIFAPR